MSNTTDAVADHALYGKSLPQFVSLLEANTNIADAMDYSALPADLRQAIWDKLDASWELGRVPDVARPASVSTTPHLMNVLGTWNASTNTPALTSGVGTQGDTWTVSTSGSTNLDGDTFWATNDRAMFFDGEWHNELRQTSPILTRPEAVNVYASRVAHVLMLDVLRLVPWELARYPLDYCQSLLSPGRLFFNWDIDGAVPAQYLYIACYDPNADWEFIKTQLGYPFPNTHEQTWDLLADATYNEMGVNPKPITHFGGTDTMCALTLPEMWAPGAINVDGNVRAGSAVTRGGCISTSPLLVLYCQLMNIPAYYIQGQFDGLSFHRSVVLPSIWAPQRTTTPSYTPIRGAVMGHGDNTHETRMSATRGKLRLEPMGYWNEHILSTGDLPTKSYHTFRWWYTIQMEHVSGSTWYLPNQGWANIAAELAPYFDQPEDAARVAKYHSDLIARNGGTDYP